MISTEETVTTKVLLDNIKDVLKIYQKSLLGEVNTFKKGILPPAPAFPAIAILPREEIYNTIWFGGQYQVNRVVRMEVYTKGFNPKHKDNKAVKLGKEIVNIFKKDIHWKQLGVIDVIPHSVFDFGPTTVGSNTIGRAAIDFSFNSYEHLPPIRVETGNKSISPEALAELIERILKNEKITNQNQLKFNEIKGIHLSANPLISGFPSVSFNLDNLQEDRRFAGGDVSILNFQFSVWEKLWDKEFSLDSNLKMTHSLKRLLQINAGWNGYAQKSRVATIQYGEGNLEELPSVGRTYQSLINYECETFSSK